MRAGVATVIPLLLSVASARPELAWMAMGGWLGTLADPGGSRRARARPLAAFALFGALVVALSERASEAPLTATLAFAAIAFASAMLRAVGPSASTIGTMLTVVAAIGSGTPARASLRDAAAFALGAGVAVVLSSIVWPVWTHLPVRRALATAFHELSTFASAIEACVADAVPEDDARWASLGRLHARSIREAIELARAMSLAVRARHDGESRVGSNLRVLLGMAEAQFLVLVTVASELEAAPRSAAAPRAALAALARTYDSIHDRVVARDWSPSSPAEASPLERPSRRPPAAASSAQELLGDLARESRAALVLAGSLDVAEPTTPREEIATGPRFFSGLRASLRRDLALMRDAFTLRSPIAHHAVRIVLAGASALLVGRLLFPRHATWVTVAALVVLQSDTGATVRRAAERVVGTVFGGLFAVLITAARPGPLVLAAIMFPLSVAAVVTRPRSYRWFTFFLTPIFVLIAVRTPGDWWVAAARAGDTLVGGGIALLAALVISPRWEERVGLPEALADMERAVDAYAAAVLDTTRARDAEALARIDETRRAAAAAVGRAEASFERLISQPLRGSRDEESRAMALVTYARRLTLAVTTLDTFVAKSADGAGPAVEAALARVERFSELLRATAARTSP